MHKDTNKRYIQNITITIVNNTWDKNMEISLTRQKDLYVKVKYECNDNTYAMGLVNTSRPFWTFILIMQYLN